MNSPPCATWNSKEGNCEQKIASKDSPARRGWGEDEHKDEIKTEPEWRRGEGTKARTRWTKTLNSYAQIQRGESRSVAVPSALNCPTPASSENTNPDQESLPTGRLEDRKKQGGARFLKVTLKSGRGKRTSEDIKCYDIYKFWQGGPCVGSRRANLPWHDLHLNKDSVSAMCCWLCSKKDLQ